VVVASNSGLAPVQVAMIFFDVRSWFAVSRRHRLFFASRPKLSVDDMEGPPLPHLLEGLSEQAWIVSTKSLSKSAYDVDFAANRVDRVRARVRLGNGRILRSRWFTVIKDDLPR
jgi:hypothetical protein